MEMELTRSMLLFYGGLAGAGISVLGALITAADHPGGAPGVSINR